MSFNNLDVLLSNPGKISQNIKTKLKLFSSESKKILNNLGVKSEDYSEAVAEFQKIWSDIKQFNQSPRAFLKNLDFATYSARQQLNWSSSMLYAYTKQQIENGISPKIDHYKECIQEAVNKTNLFPAKSTS